MPLTSKIDNKISEKNTWRVKISDIKYEYINGDIFAMAGAGQKHNQISGNTLIWEFSNSNHALNC